MARLAYPELDDLPAESRRLLDELPPLNIFRMMAGTGAAFAPFMSLVNAMLNQGALDPELRELVILRVGHLCRSHYELHQHERVSRELGMSEERIRTAGNSLPGKLFSDAENAALRLTDDLVHNTKASERTFRDARGYLTDQQMRELVLIVGMYMAVCRFLETLEIEIENAPIKGTGLEAIKQSTEAHGGRAD